MKKTILYLAAVILMPSACYAQRKDHPPVIIIMADQLRFDVLGELTPHIESLRSDGVSFERTYCASPICVPSRASFFTGLYPNNHGSLINGWEDEDALHGKVRTGVDNLYSLMEGKWDSRHVGKQHLFTEENIQGISSKTQWITQKDYSAWLKQRHVRKPGGSQFKAMVPEMVSGERTHTRTYSIPVTARYDEGLDNFLDHYIADKCIEAIRTRSKRRSLLLNAMFLAPHPPFHIPEPYFSMFETRELSLPENVGQWYAGQSPLQLYNLTGFLGTRYARADWLDAWRKYLGLVKLLDDEVGRIIQVLKAEGLYDESIIVFTSDHGEMLGSHSLWQKMCMYEESARVPLIIKFPKAFQAKVKSVPVPVSLVDVLPTLLHFTDITVPGNIDGKSLVPLVSGMSQSRDPIFVQYDGNGSLGNFQRCVVDGDFKLIADIFKNEIFIELYDVISDPQEKTNLAFDVGYAERVRSMLATLKKHMELTGDRLTLPDAVYQQFLSHYNKIIER